jgi:radical SAM-linked protein
MRQERRDFLVKLNAVTRKTKPVLALASEAGAPDIEAGASVPQVGASASTGELRVDAEAAPPVTTPDAGPRGATHREEYTLDPAKAEGAPRQGGKKRVPTAHFDQGKVLRVRIGYTKLGRAAYRSHLDLVRLLPRIFRRLDLPMYYSQGFHPKPEMTFGPALPLGVASQAEYVDVKLIEAPGITEESVRARLCGASLEGITFRDARVLGPNDGGVAKVIEAAEYVVGLPWTCLLPLGLGDDAALGAYLAQRLATPLTVVRDMKGIKRTIDVSFYLREVRAGEGRAQLEAAGIVGELAAFSFRVAVTGSGGVRPSEVLEALLHSDALLTSDLPARIVRTFMGKGTLSPLALEALRALQDTRVGAGAAEPEVDTESPMSAEFVGAELD